MEIKGKVKNVLPVESGAGKNGKEWKRQDFIVEFMDGEYSKILALTARTDNTLKAVNDLKSGMDVTVQFNIESREYNGKYYTNATAWKIEADKASVPSKSDLPF
jgi:hypothetical protein